MSWLISLFLTGVMAVSPSSVQNNFVERLKENTTLSQSDETERFEQTYPLNAEGRVSVSNVNGSITIETWDKNEVRLEAVKTAEYREDLDKVKIKIDANRDFLRIETDYDNWNKNNRGDWKSRRFEVAYRLSVPRNAVLDEIETVNGSVNITDARNITKISTVNGTIKAVNLSGTASISTVNGTIDADFARLENVSAISVETVNGSANLTLPSDADATIKADTVNGGIANDFGLPVRKGKYVGRDLYGRLGAGKIKINLETVNGAMNIRRRQDGRSVNPATNLLSVDEESSFENEKSAKETLDSAAMSRKINRETQKAMRDAQREIRKNQKEIQKVQAEIDADRIQSEVGKAVAAAAIAPMAVVMDSVAKSMGANLNYGRRRGLRNVSVQSDKFDVPGKPKVRVEAKNSKVFVRGWDKSEVAYTVYDDADSNSDVQAEAIRNNYEITLTVNKSNHSTSETRIEIFVPRKTDLKINTDGEIRVEGVVGELSLTGMDEAVNVRDAEGKLEVLSNDGAIRVIGFTGEISSTTNGGATSLEGDFQKLSAVTDGGGVIVTLPENANAVLQSDTEIRTSGFEAVKTADDNTWRIGQGGANYVFNTSGGSVLVRNHNQLKTNF